LGLLRGLEFTFLKNRRFFKNVGNDKLLCNYSAHPHPKSLSPGRGTSIRLPFSQWEKGLEDEGRLDIELAT